MSGENNTTSTSRWQACLLMWSRMALAGWVGAAVLFVWTGIHEVTADLSPLAASPVRDALVAVRFPVYYRFGWMMVGSGWLCVLLLPGGVVGSVRRKRAVLLLSGAALGLMLVDYFWIFTPLLEMVTPPGRVRPAEFVTYHKASMWINAADVGLCFAAAVLLCRAAQAVSRPV